MLTAYSDSSIEEDRLIELNNWWLTLGKQDEKICIKFHVYDNVGEISPKFIRREVCMKLDLLDFKEKIIRVGDFKYSINIHTRMPKLSKTIRNFNKIGHSTVIIGRPKQDPISRFINAVM